MKLTNACLNDLRAYLEMEQMESGYHKPFSLYNSNLAYLVELRREFHSKYGLTIEQAEESRTAVRAQERRLTHQPLKGQNHGPH